MAWIRKVLLVLVVAFALFYLFCGLAAGLAHALAYSDSVVPALGASGAIAAMSLPPAASMSPGRPRKRAKA